AAMPSHWSRLTAACRPRCLRRCGKFPTFSRSSRCSSNCSSPGGNGNAGEDQSVAHGMIDVQALAQQCDGQYRAEYRNEVNERCGTIGAHELNATVEKQIAEQRREHAKIDQAESTDIVENDSLPERDLQPHGWQQKQSAAAHTDGE